ncbi:MAG: hypothetical protein R3C03_04425 [Pirellulaceae bacterium]
MRNRNNYLTRCVFSLIFLSLFSNPKFGEAFQQANYFEGKKVDVQVDGQWCAGELKSKNFAGKWDAHYRRPNGTYGYGYFSTSDIDESKSHTEDVFPDQIYFQDQPDRDWNFTLRGKREEFHGKLVSRHGNQIFLRSETFRANGHRMQAKGILYETLPKDQKEYIESQKGYTQAELEGSVVSGGVKFEAPQPFEIAAATVPLNYSSWSYSPGQPVPLPPLISRNILLAPPEERSPLDDLRESMIEFREEVTGRKQMEFGGSRESPLTRSGNDGVEFNTVSLDLVTLSSDGQGFAAAWHDTSGTGSCVQFSEGDDSPRRAFATNVRILALSPDTRSVIRLANTKGVKKSRSGSDFSALEIISESTGKYFYIPTAELGDKEISHAVFVNDEIALAVGSQITAFQLKDGVAYQTSDKKISMVQDIAVALIENT